MRWRIKARHRTMIYKFKSKATGDLVMLEPQGRQLMQLLGREPSPKGILEVRDMPAARQRLLEAIAQAETAARDAPAKDRGTGDDERRPAVGLRQRLWPFLQMIERAQAADEPVVWGT